MRRDHCQRLTSACAALTFLAIALGTVAARHGAYAAAPQAQATQSQPAQPTAGVKPFQPGVQIDWQRRTVLVSARVVMKRGPLEFFACWPGKEHESVLRIDAAPEHVYMALGLVGISPGHPPKWIEQQQRYSVPEGDLLDISMTWQTAEGEQHAGAFDWMREIEYARAPLPRPWVFAGSLRRDDDTLVCGHTGVGFAIVDFPDSFVTLSTGYSSADDLLWVEAAMDAIPPLDAPITLELRPATARTFTVRMDARGDLYVDGRLTAPRDFADVLRLNRLLAPDHVQTISADGALHADIRHITKLFESTGLPPAAFQLTQADSK